MSISLPCAASNTWVSEVAWNSNDPWALYPSKFGGNDIEPIGDACWNAANDPFSVVLVGGTAWNGWAGGALYWGSDGPLSLVYVAYGGRGLEITS